MPHFPADEAPPDGGPAEGAVKVPAAWLIERAGFTKGYPADGPARISTKHTLALTNPGAGTTADLLALAREIRAGVRAMFGIDLANEPVLVGRDPLARAARRSSVPAGRSELITSLVTDLLTAWPGGDCRARAAGSWSPPASQASMPASSSARS